jgi:hypothetical protein
MSLFCYENCGGRIRDRQKLGHFFRPGRLSGPVRPKPARHNFIKKSLRPDPAKFPKKSGPRSTGVASDMGHLPYYMAVVSHFPEKAVVQGRCPEKAVVLYYIGYIGRFKLPPCRPGPAKFSSLPIPVHNYQIFRYFIKSRPKCIL